MGKLIEFAEVRRARERRLAQRERESLERAIELIELNLALASAQLADASAEQREELLDRTRKLSAVLEYGLNLLSAS